MGGSIRKMRRELEISPGFYPLIWKKTSTGSADSCFPRACAHSNRKFKLNPFRIPRDAFLALRPSFSSSHLTRAR